MTGFGVGVMHNTINSRFGPKPLIHADYLTGLAPSSGGRPPRRTLPHWPTPFLRDNTWVYLHALEPADLSIGGRGPGAPWFRVDLTVFEGALDKQRKGQLAADVHAAVCDAAGIEPQGTRAFHVGTLIHEIPEGSWAGGGRIIY